MKNIFKLIKDYIYPNPIKCIICENAFLHNENHLICKKCLDKLINQKQTRYYKYIENDDTITIQQLNDFNDAQIVCLYPYNSTMSILIKKLKFKYEKDMAYIIADNISNDIAKIQFDEIVPLISSNHSIRERGFNHIELICKEISNIISKPSSNYLYRSKNVRHQVGLNKKSRFANVKNTFKTDYQLKGKTILLIDDVLTSGASTYYAQKALKLAKANVLVLCICKA